MPRRIWLSGYRNYELNIFKDDDPKLLIIKKALRAKLINLLDDGMEWVITGGQLGVEQWGVDVAHQLQKDYSQLKIGIILPFNDFGHHWNENNQNKLQKVLAMSDCHALLTKKPYQSPRQLRVYQQFMLKHTDGALLVYDPENGGKPQYDYQAIQAYQQQHCYNCQLIDMYELQSIAETW